MKAFSIAAAVTLVLAFLCILDSCAVPFNGGQQMEEAGGDTPLAALPDVPGEPWMMPYHVRQRRQSNLSLCRWCCNCCQAYKGCGFCCRY
ncbi:hepcidin-1 [Dunckerocampus dactyliophorus]|uniref:hepcidin-1 n=1 Tax=Dunckerocampus dactyliophorus TaxID=161453 RepID=UPI0024067F54|nr:hepcidin-1 [Dunckerocampus dactyliophorus]